MKKSEEIKKKLKGNYNVYVTDDNGCTESASFNIMEPLEIQINYILYLFQLI